MRDPYQTSVRNFGPSRPQRRAPVDAVDAEIAVLAKRLDEACHELCAGRTPALGDEILQLTEALARKRFERDEIIRTFFYR